MLQQPLQIAATKLSVPRWLSSKRIHLPMQDMQETGVQPLGWENTLEEAMATHFTIRAQRSPWTEEPGGLQSHMVWRFIFLMWGLRLGNPMWGLVPSLLWGNFCNCNYSLICGSPTRNYRTWLYSDSTPPTLLIVLFISLVVEDIFLEVPIFSSNSFGVPIRGVELSVFLFFPLGQSPCYIYKHCCIKYMTASRKFPFE